MMKKILISVLVACSLFMISMSSVLAADETETITDDEDDVMDWLSETEEDMFVSNKPNIDIVKVIFERQDNVFTFILTVKGEIENKGDIDDVIEETEGAGYVAYSLNILTSQDSIYQILYVNNQCQLWYYPSMEIEEVPEPDVLSEDDFIAEGSNLTISFTLKNTSENYDSLEVETAEVKYSLTDPEMFFDLAPDYDENGGDGDDDDGDDDGDDDVDGDGNGNTGTDDSSNSGILLFVAAIGIIVVAGVAVLIYIIRR